jgi:hypothetical protein
MVHGNHEDFAHLAAIVPPRSPAGSIDVSELPAVDPGGHIRLLPSGWSTRLERAITVAAIGGIEEGQRRTTYHPMAYLDQNAIRSVAETGPFDILITHQGPALVQRDPGAKALDRLLRCGVAKMWCHGHSVGRDASDVVPAAPGPTRRSFLCAT